MEIYVPNDLGFTLDEEQLFNENRSRSWNGEHAQLYPVSCIANFHFVTSVEPFSGSLTQ